MAVVNSNGFTNQNCNTDVSNSNYTSEERSKPYLGTGILRNLACLQKIFLLILEILFEKSAMFISRRPFHVIFIFLFAVIVLTSGLAKLEDENSVKYLFLPEDSEASLDIRKARDFGFEIELRQEEVIILPKNNKSVVSPECLAEMIDLHRIITQIKMYEQHCFRPNPNSGCASINILEIFDYQKQNLLHVPQRITGVLKNNAFLMSNGRRLKDNFNQIFGKAGSNGSLHATNAMRFVYFMKEYSRGEENRKHILDWEKSFLKRVSSFSENTTCAKIVYAAERSLDDSVAESTGSDIKFFALTFVIMGIFSAIVNGRCADVRFGHQLLGLSSQLCIYLGVTAALGFLMFLGVPFVSIVGVLPFLVVSIGIDDVFIILHELNNMVRQNIPAMHMLSGTMARSGPTITMTTLTDLVAFAVSCRSLFPAIRYFCTYAALAIWSAFFLLVTLFVGFIWFDIKRINAGRRDFLPCLMSPPSTNRCANTRKFGIDNVMKAWGQVITSLPGKFTVCLCSLLLLSGGIYGAINIDQSFSRQLLTTEDSHFREFLNVYEENFHLNIEVSIILPGQVGRSVEEIQTVHSIVENLVKSNKHFISGSTNWLSEYLFWASERNVTVTDENVFYKSLSDFVSVPKYRRFAQDLKFSENKSHLTASRILFYSKSSSDSIFQRDMMISIRGDLSHSTNVGAFAVALPFVYFEQYAHVFRETIRNLIVAGVSILLISSLFLNHLAVITCLLCGFIGHMLELLGLMYVWNVSINSISMINLVMALGFSVDYNAHVAYHFASSKASSPELRVIDALGKIGGSVFLGGLSTFLGMMPTGFASSTVFQIFFKMFVGIVFLGLVHGLAILPVYLTLLGKIFDFREINVHPLLLEWSKRLRKQTYQGAKTSSHSKCPVNSKNSIPAAIVGIGCRFPAGANSKDAFWDMLVEGRCGIGTYPLNRPNSKEYYSSYNPGKSTPGKHYVVTGAYLDNITGFDAQFFGISPAECQSMDPQQRLLLQVVYEAIEDAGMRLEDLQQCRTGVYVGSMNLEYGTLVMDSSNIRNIDQFCSTGCALSVVANRISFSLNLTGPSLALDTACSSSLVALDVAFRHLQTGECDVAIVCAPNILLTGDMYHTACCRSGLLAHDGRCKSFDIKGDGYGRGEGVAAVVIKPTKTAIDDRDDIYAEVVACGVNNDGQTAIPMTAPSEVTQSILFQKVLQESGLSKDDIHYVEAHGTGTAVGDVVEMGSLAAVYGNSSNRILRLGSVKSNINHTESTAGLAGLIKTCLMIKHGKFVPTINVNEIKPQLKISERRMTVQVSCESWKTDDGKPRTAAVSSYGFGGANAHVIVRQVSQKDPASLLRSRRITNRVLTLSAASGDALRALAKKVSQSLREKPDDDERLKDNICYSLNDKYTVHSHRLALAFSSFEVAAKRLDMFADQEEGWEKFVASGDVTKTRNKVVFLYGGQGSQWYGMAREMLVHEPKFKESIEKIDALLKRYKVPWSLISELNKSEEASRLHENPIGQTALFAIHFALTELLECWGITPSAVVGHSLGEISAAWASGSLRLQKALQLVLFRSKLHEKCSSTGCMAAIGLSEEEARNMLQGIQMQTAVDVAVINSPGNVVLSGTRESIDYVENHVKHTLSGVFWKKLTTTRAYHSQEMEQIRERYFKITSEFNLHQSPNSIPFYSTVTGTQVSGQLLSLEHWWKNIRQAVLFEHALRSMFSDGYQFFIEINASPQLAHHVRQTWSQKEKRSKSLSSSDALVVQTLPKRSANEQHLSFLHNCAAHLFTNGVPLSWEKVHGSGPKSFIRRPTYPWQESEFWFREKHPLEFVTFLDESKTLKKGGVTNFHPLLGKSVPTETFTGLCAWEAEISLYNIPYISDHKFAESPDPVIPAAVYVEMILAMAMHLSPTTAPDVHNISFDNLLAISNNDSHIIRTRLLPRECLSEENRFQITLVQDHEGEMAISEGSIKLGANDWCGSQETSLSEKFGHLKSTMNQFSRDDLEREREKLGFAFGPHFDLISKAWSNGVETLCLIRPTEEINKEASAYCIHPSIIDACFQSMLLLKTMEGKFVPRKITNVSMVQNPTCTDQFYVHTKIVDSAKTPTCNITLMDGYARPVMIIEEFVTGEISVDKAKVTFQNASFTFGWEQITSDTPTADQNNNWLLLRDENKFAERFSQHVPDNDIVHFVDIQHTLDATLGAFSEALDEVREKITDDERLLVINFWPVDCSTFSAEASNFDATHGLAFETCLLVSQEVLKREAFAKNIQLVFVTSDVVTIPRHDRNPAIDTSGTFPWSASVLGFRRTFSEEISAPKASVVDLPSNPCDNDLRAMVDDVRKATIEEELVYRDGVRYANRFKKIDLDGENMSKKDSPVTKDGARKSFKMTSMSGQWFVQKTSSEYTKENSENVKIEVDFVCPILQKPWLDLKKTDRIGFSGRIFDDDEEKDSAPVVGVCKIDDLGSVIDVKKCCFAHINVQMNDSFSSQEAASLAFPMAMSYHILTNLLSGIKGKTVLVYHRNEEVCKVFACVAMTLDVKVIVCLVKDRSSKERMLEFQNLMPITVDEITRGELNGADLTDLDAVCFLSKNSSHVIRQIMKHLNPYGNVISVYGEENVELNRFIHGKDVQCIMTNLENVTEDSESFSKLVSSCCLALKSRGLLESVLNIPQQVSSIYDVVYKGCKNEDSCLDGTNESGLYTVSLKPEVAPDKVNFYNLPLDENGLKADRTYLVIGGVRGFGYEVAKWMAENGAKTVMCTARSAPSEDKKAEVKQIEKETKSRILLRQADITSWADMSNIKKELEILPPVAGIVFSAMVLENQLVKDADFKISKKVIETKIKGSAILHQLSLSMDLDFFIMFSSISGILGNVGQAAYAAANTFLDQLCEYRRHKLGLPGLSVNWGPISGTGVLERNTNNITSILEKAGFYSLHYTTAIEFLKQLLLENTSDTQVCLSSINWLVYLQNHSSSRLQLIREETLVLTEENNFMTLEDLALQPLEFRMNYVQKFIQRLLASWSGADAVELDLNVGLYKYGIDSIAAAQTRLRIENTIGATFETYYFIQPKTTGLTIINDILEQIENVSVTKDQKGATSDNHHERGKHVGFSSDISQTNVAFDGEEGNDVEGSIVGNGYELQHQAPQTVKEKVIPLYTPDDAVVRVFMIHGSQKSALALASFALGFQQQTNVSLYAIGVEDNLAEKNEFGTVMSLAQRYVGFIQNIQPRGPYYLAGYSFGGTVAYEMASELKRKRETVAMVFMVDTYSWFPEGLPHHSAFVEKYAERNLKKMQNPTIRQLIEKMAFVGLGITRNEVDRLFEELGDSDNVIASLMDRAAKENVTFPLKETVDTVLYELKSAAKAHVTWQPSKISYDGTITYICCDETNSTFSLWRSNMWKSLVKKIDFLYVPGNHLELLDETRGKICGSMMMTTAAMKYQASFSTFCLRPVRSRPQERLVEFLKQGMIIWMLSSPSSSKLVKGTLQLNSEETCFCFEHQSFGRRVVQKSFLKDLSNIIPGRHVNVIRRHHGNKSYIDFLVCMLNNNDKVQTYRAEDWQQLKKFTDALEALFGIPFMQ